MLGLVNVPQNSPTTGDLVLAIFVGSLCVLMVVVWLIVCSKPGQIARRRGHPQASAINICGWIGTVFFPLLIVAYVWAWGEKDEMYYDQANRALGFPVKPVPVKPIESRAGRFKISGVVKATGADVKTYIEAASCENALVKAELKGIVVTAI